MTVREAVVGRVRRDLPAVGSIVVAAVGLAALVSMAWAWATYGVFGWSSTPTRFGYCGQTDTRFDDVPRTWGQVVAMDSEALGGVVLEPTIGTLPVLAPVPSGYAPGAGYNGCGHLVVLHLASGYWRYDKLGGP